MGTCQMIGSVRITTSEREGGRLSSSSQYLTNGSMRFQLRKFSDHKPCIVGEYWHFHTLTARF